MTHTRGPWEYQANEDNTLYTISDSKGWVIASDICGFNAWEIEANANLIAAAPELLEVCVELLAWAESVQGYEVSSTITQGKGTIFEDAREAIAKAKGD